MRHGAERRNLSKEQKGVMIGGIFLDLTFRILVINQSEAMQRN